MKTTLPAVLEQKLAGFRRRVWALKLTEALLSALFGIALSYLAVLVLDRFCETPAWLRLGLLLAGGATLGLGVPLKWHRWVWRQRRLEDAARLFRGKFPRLGDEMLGLVELARKDHLAEGRSERLVEAAMAQVALAVKDVDFDNAVPDARHRQWAWAAATTLVLVAAAFSVIDGAARNALVRWLTPWRPIERFTFARTEPLPARLVVPYAEPFALPLRLSADTQWSPGAGSARIGRQPVVEAKLAAGVYPLSFPPQKDDSQIAIRLGDLRKTVELQPRTRPEMARLLVQLRLPDYLGYGSEQSVEVRGGSVSLLRGARAAFAATASRELASAELDGKSQTVAGEKILTGYEPVSADLERRFTWKDVDGLTPREPFVLRVRATGDEMPRIAAHRESQEQVVLDSEVVTFDLSASDDFGIKAAGLEWAGPLGPKGSNSPLRGQKVAAAGAPENGNSRRGRLFAPAARASSRRRWNCGPGRSIICLAGPLRARRRLSSTCSIRPTTPCG